MDVSNLVVEVEFEEFRVTVASKEGLVEIEGALLVHIRQPIVVRATFESVTSRQKTFTH